MIKLVPAIVIGVLMTVVGVAWSLATPPLSGADDDYHLTSVVCAGDGSPFCTLVSESVARVPRSLAGPGCYVLDRSRGADCFRWDPELVETSRWSSVTSYRSSIFYDTMALSLGSDLWRSIVSMRIFNAAVGGFFFAFAFAIARRSVRVALAFAVLTVFLPVGVFHISSNNPTSWAVVGVGTFWAFLMTFWSSGSLSKAIRMLAAAGVGASGVIALAGRADSAIYLGASVLAVAVLRWRYLRQHLLALLPIAGLALAAVILARQRLLASLDFFTGNLSYIVESFFWWWPRFHILEWPLLMSYVFGGSTPRYMPYPLSYTSGFGWDNRAGVPLEFPSIVGLAGLATVVAVVLIGLSRYSWRKALAVSVIGIAILLMSLGYVWFTDFAVWAQARYYFGPMFVLVGVVTLLPRTAPPLRALQVAILAVGSFAGSVAALVTIVRSSTNGQPLAPDVAWSAYEAQEQWWWPDLGLGVPFSANETIILGAAAITLLIGALLFLIQWELSRVRGYRPDSKAGR